MNSLVVTDMETLSDQVYQIRDGQPAAVVHRRDQHGNYQPYGICVLTVTAAGIRRISSFGDPRLVTAFGFRPDMAHP